MSDKDVRLPFDGFSDPETEANEPANDFWEDIAETLDKIEQNTRGGRFSATGKSNNSRSPQAASNQPHKTTSSLSPTPRQSEQSRTPVAGPSKKTQSVSSTSGVAEQPSSSKKKAEKSQAVKSVASVHVSSAKSDEKKKQTTEIRRLEAVSKQHTNGILKQLRTGLSKWDGSVGGMKLNTSNIGDMVGMALGGPFWTAFKELKDVVIQDGQNSEKSLSSLFKKTFPRKPEAKTQNGRQRDSNGRFIGGDNNRQQLKLAEESHALAEQQVATGKKRHDELIKAVKANKPKTNLFGRGGLLDSFRRRGAGGLPGFGRDRRVAVPDARMPHGANGGHRPEGGAHPPAQGKKGKTHGRGRKAGLLAGAAALFGGGAMYMGSRGDNQSALDTASTALDTAHTATQGSKAAAEKSATHSATKVGEAGAKATTQTATQGGKAVAEKATGSAATKTAEAGAKTAATAGKVATAAEAGAGKAATSIGGKVASLGAKGAMGAAKAIPIAGQLLAAGMAVYDGVNGWNDTEMHQEAFGLKEGEEASTGQKASAAAANVLDMGGLLTGGASLLGFDVSTADIAKGIYDVGDKVGEVLSDPVGSLAKAATGLFDGIKGFFGGGDKEKDKDKEEKSPTNEQKAQSEKKGETSAADIAKTTALVAAPVGIMAAMKSGSGGALPIPEAPAVPTQNVQKPARKGISPLAVGAIGVAGAAGIYAGSKALLSDDEKDNEKEAAKTASTLGADKIPSLLESLTKALTDLTEKLEDQIKQAANAENGGVFNIFGGGGGGFGGGAAYGGSGGGGYSGGSGGGSSYSSSAAYSGLGDIVMQGETGGKGTAMISSGAGDHGGVSYGRSQLASRINGSIGDALNWAKANGFEDIYNELAPLQGDATNRNGQFAQKWAQLASEKGGRLEQFDREYQKKGYYDPMMAKIRQANPELAKRIDANPALQEQVLSTSVQYGKNSSRFLTAANEVLGKNANVSDRDLVAGIQDIKARDVGSNFKSSSAGVQNGVRNRHGNVEKKRLLALQDRFERGEIKIDPATGTAQAIAAPATQNNANQILQFDSASQGVRLNEDGKTVNLSTVKGIDSLRLQHGVNIDKMHPEAVSRMASAAADYEKLTGQKLEISEGYRDYAEQVRTKRKHGNNAATPGKSTHGTGNTFDVAKSKIVDVENRLKAAGVDPVKFFEDHGLKRTAYRPGASRQNDESWHFEAEDLRTAEMQQDRKNFQSGKKTGAEYLTAEQRAKYMAPQGQSATAVAEANPEEKTPPTSVASAETQQATNPEIAQAQNEAKTQATVVADASKSAEAASTATQQVAEALPKAATTVANAEPVSPQSQQSQNAPVQRQQKQEPSQAASAGPITPQPAQEAPKTVAFAQNGPMQSMQNLLSQTGSFLSKIPGVNSDILAPVHNVFGKVQTAMDMVKSPQAMIDNFLPKEAQPLVANVQKVAGDLMPLASSVGGLLPSSASPFLSEAQNILGQIAKPQFPSSLPDYTQLFGQPLQVASNVMQAMPQIPTRLPDPAALMPTQSMQQGGGFDVGPIVNVLTELLDVTKKNTKDKEKETEEQNSSNIPMDFDDAYCFRFAHDMA